MKRGVQVDFSDACSGRRKKKILFITAGLAVCFLVVGLRLALACSSPTSFGYVYDFYHEPILMYYETGEIPDSDDCWQCYHPPVYTLFGEWVFSAGMALSGGAKGVAQAGVAFSSVFISFVFISFAWLIVRHYVKHRGRRLLMLFMLLSLPCLFISSFSIESDLLCATFILIAFYFFLRYRQTETRVWLHVLVMGVAAGMAIGTKYSGIIILMVLSLLFFVAFLQDRKPKFIVHLTALLALSLLIGGWRYLDNVRTEGRLFVGNEAWRHVDGQNRKFYFKEYEFHTFRLRELVSLMKPESPQKELKHFDVYNYSVLTSLFGQIWTDCSIFSNPSRHGLRKGLYPEKSIPISLVAALLCVGIVPVLLGGVGMIGSICRAKHVPLLVLSGISILVYTRWFLAHPEWALKTKYLFQIIPAGLVFCSFGLASLGRRSEYAEKIAVGALILLVVLANAYNFFFAIT